MKLKNGSRLIRRLSYIGHRSLIMITLILSLNIPRALAGYDMKENEEKFAKFGFKLQDWFQVTGNAAPDGTSPSTNVSIKALRFYINGQINPLAKFSANVDWQRGVWDGAATPNSTAVVRDAQILFDFNSEAKTIIGLFRTPFSRVALQDSFAYVLPHSPDIAGAAYIGDTADYRNLGLTYTGEVSKGKIKYYAGTFDGYLNPIGATTDNASAFYSGRISFNLSGAEKGYVNQGTYLGKNNMVSLGTGYLAGNYKTGTLSPLYTAWTIDAFIEQDMDSGVFTGEAAYFNYNRGINDGHTSGWYLLAGYLLPSLNIQPALRYEKSDRDSSIMGGEDYHKTSAGINWYLKGHDSKLQLEYAIKDYDTEGLLARINKDFADLTIAFQVQF
ncbi:MAG: hypothetical protein A3J83_09210 [Elusimicrobia bacterium RIFOXYA2_FULL_40_6]|nr:MAG: hypothetical protein A3J83_09210 [Elusimicrobia bacterium RIFOXYA2_FULL_40_6]